jgi:hypothetical protein
MGSMKIPEDIREYFRRQGKIGAKKRNAKLTPERRREIALFAAETRWKKSANNDDPARGRK